MTVRKARLNLCAHYLQKKKSLSPTVRAVARLTSSKTVIRQATLAWLEQTGAWREPEYLTLTSHTELLDVVRALRECQQRNQPVRRLSFHIVAKRALRRCA